MSDTTYNGWENYETWRVNLELAEDICNNLREDGQTFADIAALADHLKDEVEEILTGYGEAPESIALDYARAFVSDVNWDEIARHWEDELIQKDEDDEDPDDTLPPTSMSDVDIDAHNVA